MSSRQTRAVVFYLQVVVVVITCFACLSTTGDESVHTAVEGTPVALPCAADPGDPVTVDWTFRAALNNTETRIVSGGDVPAEYQNRFKVQTTAGGQEDGAYGLRIENVSLSDAGFYTCSSTDGVGTNYTVELLVVANDAASRGHLHESLTTIPVWLWHIVGFIVLIVIIVVTCIAYRCIHKHIAGQRIVHPEVFQAAHSNLNVEESTTAGLKIPYSSLEEKELIGAGGFGTVYRAKHPQLGVVAYKEFDRIVPEENAYKTLMHELEMRNLDHPNIVSMIGFTLEPEHYGIVLEYAAHGGLNELIDPHRPIDMKLKERMIVNIVDGMCYLHSRQPPVIHSDLKLANILIMEDYTAKISDFGLSRWTSSASSNGGRRGTESYIAPEHWQDIHCSRSTTTDVYAFGILLWELLTESEPYKESNGNTELIRSAVMSGQRPDMSLLHESHGELKAMIESCWAQKREDRPSFHQIRQLLDQYRRPVGLSLCTSAFSAVVAQ